MAILLDNLCRLRYTLAMQKEPTFTLGYRPALDGVRAIAILMVMAFHVGMLSGGFLGVDMFFVLSGFLITTLLLEEHARSGRISLPQFYLRRAFRLLPALYVCLGACAAFVLIAWPDPLAVRTGVEIPFALVYASNWGRIATGVVRGLLGHMWSLAVEEQFYLLWPPLLSIVLWLRPRRWHLLMLVLLGALAAATWRAVLCYNGATALRLNNGSDTRADALLIGCALAIATVGQPLRALRRLSPAPMAVCLLGLPVLAILVLCSDVADPALNLGGLTVVAITAAALILWPLTLDNGLAARLLGHPLLAAIGRISYAVYLWHWPIRSILLTYGPPLPRPVFLAVYVALSFLAAILSRRFIEAPASSLRIRLAARGAAHSHSA